MAEKTTYNCEFCEKSFSKESTLMSHLCRTKRRYDSKNDSYVRLGFEAYQTWYQLSGANINRKKQPDFREFIKSKFYMAFVKFGRHIIATKLVNPKEFIKYVITNRIKLDNWTKDSTYEAYVRDVGKRESVDVSLDRFAKLTMEWSEEAGEDWQEYFAKAPSGDIMKNIRNGKISPWIVFKSNTIYKWFDRISPEQMDIVNNFIDVNSWNAKMRKEKKTAEFVENALEELGI
jgi:hypothetical protein